MKLRILALVVLLASSLNAQSPEISVQARELGAKIDQLSSFMGIRNQIDAEFAEMTVELRQLHNAEVDRVMLPHVQKVLQLNSKLLAVTQKEKKP